QAREPALGLSRTPAGDLPLGFERVEPGRQVGAEGAREQRRHREPFLDLAGVRSPVPLLPFLRRPPRLSRREPELDSPGGIVLELSPAPADLLTRRRGESGNATPTRRTPAIPRLPDGGSARLQPPKALEHPPTGEEDSEAARLDRARKRLQGREDLRLQGRRRRARGLLRRFRLRDGRVAGWIRHEGAPAPRTHDPFGQPPRARP